MNRQQVEDMSDFDVIVLWLALEEQEARMWIHRLSDHARRTLSDMARLVLLAELD